MQKITFQDATVVKAPYVEINGVEYPVIFETEGGTDLDAETFNDLQDNVENAINGIDFPVIDNLTTNDSEKSLSASMGNLLAILLGANVSFYNAETSYIKGDKVIYNNVLYYCEEATTGTFNNTKWTPIILNGSKFRNSNTIIIGFDANNTPIYRTWYQKTLPNGLNSFATNINVETPIMCIGSSTRNNKLTLGYHIKFQNVDYITSCYFNNGSIYMYNSDSSIAGDDVEITFDYIKASA